MSCKAAYWISTSIMSAMMTFSSLLYLSGSSQAVTAFTNLGYPQHLRIILGIAKLAGVIVLLAPGFRVLKEWAYAGFTFAWIIAAIAHSLVGEGSKSVFAIVLLALLVVSYLTRPSSRRVTPSAASA
jgi:hypothetical protein